MPLDKVDAPTARWVALGALSVVTAFLGVGSDVSFAAVPAGPLPELAQVGKPSPEEAARLIAQFRSSGIPGDYYLDFELRSLPRRGEGPTYRGRWWGTRNDNGAVTRVELMDAAGVAHRLLIQNGAAAKVWRSASAGPVEVGVAELMVPLIPGVEISAFDLQMPYLYWPGATVDRITRVLGRPSNEFVFPAPESFRAQHGEITSARAYLDTQFNVPTKTEIIGLDGKVIKTLSLLDLQTVNKQTLFKSADYRNELTRDKTRLQVTGAALNLALSRSLFDPSSLGQSGTPPLPDSIVRLSP